MIRIPQQKKKFKAQGILLESESRFRTDSGVGTDGLRPRNVHLTTSNDFHNH